MKTDTVLFVRITKLKSTAVCYDIGIWKYWHSCLFVILYNPALSWILIFAKRTWSKIKKYHSNQFDLTLVFISKCVKAQTFLLLFLNWFPCQKWLEIEGKICFSSKIPHHHLEDRKTMINLCIVVYFCFVLICFLFVCLFVCLLLLLLLLLLFFCFLDCLLKHVM